MPVRHQHDAERSRPGRSSLKVDALLSDAKGPARPGRNGPSDRPLHRAANRRLVYVRQAERSIDAIPFA